VWSNDESGATRHADKRVREDACERSVGAGDFDRFFEDVERV